MLLGEVVGNVVHIPYGPGPAMISAERASRSDEVTAAVHFVCEVNLTQNQCQYDLLGEVSVVTYRSGRKGECTQRSVSGPWVFSWDGFHDTG